MKGRNPIPDSRCRDPRVVLLRRALGRVRSQTELWLWVYEEAIRHWDLHGKPSRLDWRESHPEKASRRKSKIRPSSPAVPTTGWGSFLCQIEPAYRGWTDAIAGSISLARAAAPAIDDPEVHVTRRMSTRLEYRLRRLLSFFPPGRLGNDGVGIATLRQPPAARGLIGKLTDQLIDDGLMLESLPKDLTIRGDEAGWTFERLCSVGAIGRGTLRAIMIEAGVPRPGSGQRDFRLSAPSLSKLIRVAIRTRQKVKWMRAGERWKAAFGSLDA